MKALLLDYLICPSCLPREIPLKPHVREQDDDDVIKAELTCPICANIYFVRQGLGQFLPKCTSPTSSRDSKYESNLLLSSYLWAHFGDLLGDDLATEAYTQWAQLISPSSGIAIDAGCAVGRFSFELASKCEFVVGIDASETFVRSARHLKTKKQWTVKLPVEGYLQREESIRLPDSWAPDRVEFIVADVEAIPLPSSTVSAAASLNIIDKVPHPLRHIKEMDRVTNIQNAQIVISDPFSWSEQIAPSSEWLGGKQEGPFEGRGIDNVTRLLEGDAGLLRAPWKIEAQGSVWWKIRNHENHFELIRSWYVKGSR